MKNTDRIQGKASSALKDNYKRKRKKLSQKREWERNLKASCGKTNIFFKLTDEAAQRESSTIFITLLLPPYTGLH